MGGQHYDICVGWEEGGMKGGVFQVICSQEDWRRRTGGGEGGGRLIIVIYTNLYDTLPCTDPDPTRPP